MGAIIKASCAYSGIVFVAGFILGVLRILAVAPLVGELGAVLIELPIILAISWIACGAIIGRYAIPARWQDRARMGAFAFILLIAAEFCLSLSLGRSADTFLAGLIGPAGAIGLIGQLAFALFPLLQSSVMPRYRRP